MATKGKSTKETAKKPAPEKKKPVTAKETKPAAKPAGKRVKFAFPDPKQPSGVFFRANAHSKSSTLEQLCELLKKEANKHIRRLCENKHFTVESIFRPCEQTVSAAGAKAVDLVVIIDTSGSMSDEATSLSNAANAAIEAAKKRCVSDLRVAWFGLEGTFAGTLFDKALRTYLHALGVADSDIDHRIGYIGQEDGGAAIKDVSEHFDWRPNATRAIFFLGDEPLSGGEPQEVDDKTAADNAIAAATTQKVTVYTYAGTGIETFFDPTTGLRAEDEFARVATSTGGLAYSAAAGNIAEFQTILEEIICSTSASRCGAVRIPEIRPCVTLQWGDAKRDDIETDDTEILCITATNPYTNVTIRDMMAFILILGPDGKPPQNLPDGTPSVVIKPNLMICFGDLAPCIESQKGEPTGISREVVMISRGALEGTYYVFVGYCYSVELKLVFGSVFPLELVKS